jgi:type IV secretory pathway VirB2 component (pilin)
MATSPALSGTSAPAGTYATATETLRATIRWLVTAAAAVGGVLVAGLQLTGIGSLGRHDLLRLAVAVTGLVLALVAVGYMILRASQILTDEWVTLADLDSERFDQRVRRDSTARRDRQRRDILERLYERLDLVGEELFGSLATDVSGLYAQLMQANQAARDDPDSARARTAGPLQQAAAAVVVFANFYITRERFKTLRRQLAGASVVVIIGVLMFAYAADPPKPAAPPTGPAVIPQPTRAPAPASGPRSTSTG